MKKHDLCIIAGDSSGYAAAMRALNYRKKIMRIEKDRIGGVGLCNSALSSKSMWGVS